MKVAIEIKEPGHETMGTESMIPGTMSLVLTR